MAIGVCTRAEPWVVFVGGPGYTRQETLTDSLVLTEEHPCGEQRLLGVTTPLRRIASYVGCVDAPTVLLTADVRSRTALVAAGRRSFDHLSGFESGVQSSQPRLKLSVTSCGMGPYLVDSDSSLVVPGGPISIDVLGPAPWVELGSANVPESDTLWTETSLRITAFPAECCPCPSGVLTTWLYVPTGAPAPARIVARPRRARGLTVDAASEVGAPVDVAMLWLHETNGAVIGSTDFMAVSQQTRAPFGAAPYALVGLTADETMRVAMRWEVAP